MGGAFGREVSAEEGCGLEDQELGTKNRASLTCRGWTAIPSSFFSQAKVAQLTALTISLNDIVELPAEMCLLSALTSLDASNNEIGHIHAAALHLPHLQELGLAFNRLVDLPNDLGNLTTLHRLTLQANQLRHLPNSILTNTSIRHLDLSLNPKFAFDHPSMRQRTKNSDGTRLPELRTLVCGFAPDRNLIEGMVHSTKLTSLSLHLNALSSIPWGDEGLPRLKKLALDWNVFPELPSSLVRCSALQFLFVAGNKITQIPPFLTELKHLRICDLSFNMIASLDVAATWRLLISCTNLESLLLYGNIGLLLSHPAQNPFQRICEAMPPDLPARVRWSGHKEDCCAASSSHTLLDVAETQTEAGMEWSKQCSERILIKDVDAEDAGYWSCATRLKWSDLQERFVEALRASGYQAALDLIYAEGFANFPDPVHRSKVVVSAVRKFRDATGVLPPSTSGCWGCTVEANGRVRVQIREAVLARGPFALIMLTLGHELVHACQMLAARKVYNANFREFEAFSWMLLDGAHDLPPISAQDRQWILEQVEAHYEALPPYLKTPEHAAQCAAAREAHSNAPWRLVKYRRDFLRASGQGTKQKKRSVMRNLRAICG